jgi:hypothetical protein
MHGSFITPQSEQIELSFAKSFPDAAPYAGIDLHARPPAMGCDA